MSLKAKLNQIIEEANGAVVTIDQIEQICKENHYKMSNAERRLRASESPNIERVFKNGAIIGYRWTNGGREEATHLPHKQKIAGATPAPRTNCCYSFRVFGTHGSECRTKIVQKETIKPIGTLF